MKFFQNGYLYKLHLSCFCNCFLRCQQQLFWIVRWYCIKGKWPVSEWKYFRLWSRKSVYTCCQIWGRKWVSDCERRTRIDKDHKEEERNLEKISRRVKLSFRTCFVYQMESVQTRTIWNIRSRIYCQSKNITYFASLSYRWRRMISCDGHATHLPWRKNNHKSALALVFHHVPSQVTCLYAEIYIHTWENLFKVDAFMAIKKTLFYEPNMKKKHSSQDMPFFICIIYHYHVPVCL